MKQNLRQRHNYRRYIAPSLGPILPDRTLI